MPIGKLKMWDVGRGYGFITNDTGGRDEFVHVKQLEKAGIFDAAVGDVFEYGVGTYNGRSEAVSIARISRADSA